jgi:hypothetical protein
VAAQVAAEQAEAARVAAAQAVAVPVVVARDTQAGGRPRR